MRAAVWLVLLVSCAGPGRHPEAPLYTIAEAGSYDAAGPFALGTRPTDFGHEAAFIRVGARHWAFSIPARKVVPWAGEAPSLDPVPADPRSPLAKHSPPAWVSGHRHAAYWGKGGFSEGPLSDGAVYALRASPRGAELLIHLLKEPRPRELGPIGFDRPLAITTTLNGDVLALGLRQGAIVLAFIEDPLVDELIKARLVSRNRQTGAVFQLTCPARAYSLTAIACHLDRPFFTLGVMSDGKVYFGPTPHHPTRGLYLFRFDPRREDLALLGEFDRITGRNGEADIPSTLHAPPVEVDGLVFFTPKEALYGRAKNFPELPAGARYAGSSLLAYELRTQAFRNFGFAEEGQSAAWAEGDGRHHLYVRMIDRNEGPVHRLDVRTGRIDRHLFRIPTPFFVVAGDGKCYFGRGKDVVRIDPATGEETVVAAGVGEVKWFNGQGGRSEIYALVGPSVYRLTVGDGAFRQVGAFPVKVGGGDAAFRNGVVYKASSEGTPDADDRVCRLLTLDLATGRAKDHGGLIDDRGRPVLEVWAMDAGADGAVYMVGPVFPRPGDPYSPRLKKQFLNDSCFLVVRGLVP